jgi:hypothetical protein
VEVELEEEEAYRSAYSKSISSKSFKSGSLNVLGGDVGNISKLYMERKKEIKKNNKNKK